MKNKMIYKIGIIPLVIILSMLFAAVPVLAQGPEPQVTATGTVNPNTVPNDGTSVLHFSWDIFDWAGTANYYTFQFNLAGGVNSPLYIQYSDGAGVDNFPGISGPLQDVNGTVGGAAVHLNQPEYTATHDWTVPTAVTPGTYEAWVRLYLVGQTPPAAGAFIGPITITQATGDLTVYKEDEAGNPLNGWDFTVYEAGTPNVIATGTTGSGANPDGYYTFEDLDLGDYDVDEDIQTDWSCIAIEIVGGSSDDDPEDGMMEDVTVTTSGVVVEFTNQQDVGTLVIHKITDPTGNEEDWIFDIDGPVADSGDTNSSGVLTFSSIPTGQYDIQEDIQAGWACVDIYVDTTHDGDPEDGEILNVDVTTGETTDVYFVNQQEGSLLIFKYEDADGSGTYNAGDTPLEDWGFQVVGVAGTYFTDSTGHVTVEDLVPDTYTVKEVLGPAPPPGYAWVCTDPGPGKQKSGIVVPAGGTSEEVQFGNQQIVHLVPTLGQWGIIIMSAAFVGLLVWFGMRRRQTA